LAGRPKPGLKKAVERQQKKVLYMIAGLQNKWIKQQKGITRFNLIKPEADPAKPKADLSAYPAKLDNLYLLR
jgi:hypothetical protein